MALHVQTEFPPRFRRLPAGAILLAAALVIGLAVLALVGDAMVLALATSA